MPIRCFKDLGREARVLLTRLAVRSLQSLADAGSASSICSSSAQMSEGGRGMEENIKSRCRTSLCDVSSLHHHPISVQAPFCHQRALTKLLFPRPHWAHSLLARCLLLLCLPALRPPCRDRNIEGGEGSREGMDEDTLCQSDAWYGIGT
eukprot:3522988-Rhodomonas_salina.1